MNKYELQPIEQQVQKAVEHHLDSSHPDLIAGVSGGPDSMAMLHIFKRLGVSVCVVHINYQQRGEHSDRDQLLVEETAQQWGMEFRSMQVGDQFEDTRNFQQQARKIRYRYFEEVRRQQQADAIAVGHHQEDQVETVLQKILRGAGLDAWSGMSVFQEYIFRPLLEVPEQQITSYIESWEVPYRIDKTNRESVYARNFLRNEWIPQFDQWFPGWRKNILRLTTIGDHYQRTLHALLESAEVEPGKLDRVQLLKWKPDVQKSVLLQWVKYYYPDSSPSRTAIDQLDDIDTLQSGQQLQLTKYLSVFRDRDVFQLVENVVDAKPGSILIRKEQLSNASSEIDRWIFRIETFDDPDFQNTLYLDPEQIEWPLKLRTWQAGDRLQPYGMKGTQKVKEHLTNRKISSYHKTSARVLVDAEKQIVALLFPPEDKKQSQPGTIADSVKCDPDNGKVLSITVSS